MRVWALMAGAVFWAVSASTVPAQAEMFDLRVRVQSTGSAPAAGALLALIDSAGQVVTEGMTSESGVRVLRARAGTYTVRVRRIGFFPFTSQRISLPRAGESSILVVNGGAVVDDKGPAGCALAFLLTEKGKVYCGSSGGFVFFQGRNTDVNGQWSQMGSDAQRGSRKR